MDNKHSIFEGKIQVTDFFSNMAIAFQAYTHRYVVL